MKGAKGPSGVETTCLRDIKPAHRLTVWPFLVVYSVILVALTLPYTFWSLLLPLFGSDADFYEDFQENFYYGTVAAIPLTGFVQIICILTTFWSVSYRCALSKRVVSHPWEATSLKVTPKPTKGNPAIVDIKCDTPLGEPYGTGFGTPEGLYYFNFQGRKFMYDKEDGCFKKRKMPVKESLGFYKECRGIQKEQVPELLRTIGKNKFEIPIPTFKELFAEHAVAPFFVFQMFCVLLWCLDEYWYYSLFTGFMLVSFEATIVQQRLRNLASLRSMEVESYDVTVFRDGAWISISSADLLPLDIMQLTHTRGNQTPCDMLILEGTCVVNEALLTGESTPQMKEGVAKRENGDQLDIKVEDKKHIIWGGTEVMLCQRDEQALDSSNFPKGPKGGSACVCVVLRTGFGTSQGSLVRTIVHTTNRVSANSAESLGFICFLLVFALAAAAYVVHRGMDNPEMTAYKMLLNCILIITSVVPPELPMELTLAVNTSLFRLAKKEIFCTEPFRIPFAGALDTCCFDKTGTLTADTMRMRGVAGQGGNQELKEAKAASEYSHLVMAGCHSLVHLEGELIGDSMEKAALKSIQWECKGTNVAKSAKNPKQHLDILHRHAFSSAKKRMSSLAIDGQGKRLVLCKGAPEVLEGLYDKSTVPDNYKEIFTFYMREGARVIALGHKVLPNGMRKEELPNIPREKAESNLVFDGFAVFDCPLKPDSMRVVHELQDSNHRVVMITGDNQLTAAHVALTLSIVDKAPLFLSIRDVQPDGSGAPVWCDYDGVEVGEQSEVLKHDLCVSGDHLGGVLQHDPNFLKQWVQHIGVFARCTPDQKAIITGTLKDLGRVVSMCGDGTNDVGALKTSHVGIALLNHPDAAPGTVVAPGMGPGAAPKRPRPIGPPPEGLGMLAKMKWIVEETQKVNQEFIKEQREAAAAKQAESGNKPKPKPKPKSAADILQEQMAGMEDVEDRSSAPQVKLGDASIAAPFTSKRSSIQCTADISRLGRCTLVTTLQMYKILALNCLTSAYSMSVLYSDGVKFGEKQMLMSGLVMTACFLLIARSEPLPKLSPQRPHNKVFTVYMMGSILGQFAIHLYTLISVVNLVFGLDPAGASEQSKDLEGEFKPSLLNSIVFLMTTIQQTTTFANNYQGRPWMTGLRDNRPMYWSLAFLGAITMFIALEVSEDFNSWIEIVPMPSSDFKWSVIFLLVQDVVGVVLVERFFLNLCKDRSYLKMKIRERQPLPPLEEQGAPPQPVQPEEKKDR